MRPIYLLCCWALLSLVALPACEDVQLGWPGESPQHPLRPAATPIQPRPAPSCPLTRPSNTPEVPPIADYYQVVLVSDGTPAQSTPGVTQVTIRQHPARRVGQLVAMLYVPAGQTGSANRFTLIYPTKNEASLAAISAGRLDLAPAAGDAFAAALTAIYAASQPTETPPTSAATTLKQQSAGAPGYTNWRAWAAGMLGGGVLMAGSQNGDAWQLFAQAEDRAAPGSLEQLSAMYSRAVALARAGRYDDARRVLASALSQFDRFRQTEVFERARQLLAELETSR